MHMYGTNATRPPFSPLIRLLSPFPFRAPTYAPIPLLLSYLFLLHCLPRYPHVPHRIELSCAALRPARLPRTAAAFYLSTRRRMMRIFAGNGWKKVLTSLRHAGRRGDRKPHGQPEDRRRPEESRRRKCDIPPKNLPNYDEGWPSQRKRVYAIASGFWMAANCKEMIVEMLDGKLSSHQMCSSTSSMAGTRSRNGPAGCCSSNSLQHLH